MSLGEAGSGTGGRDLLADAIECAEDESAGERMGFQNSIGPLTSGFLLARERPDRRRPGRVQPVVPISSHLIDLGVLGAAACGLSKVDHALDQRFLAGS